MSIGRQLGMGRLWYQLWHRPRARWLEIAKQGGWFRYRDLLEGQRRLAVAAESLSSTLPEQAPRNRATINVLTGTRYWDQTAACLWSLSQCSGRAFSIRIIDDGSLTPAQAQALKRLSPKVHVQSETESRERLERFLPAAEYPTLNRLWPGYKHIRKIIDAHLGRDDFNLVLDSDMLFYRQPDLLLAYLDQPHGGLAMTDCAESYGYARAELIRVAGHDVPTPVNVGVLGMNSGAIDWALVERWTTELTAQFGHHYFLEQSLSAMLLGGMPHQLLPRDTYKVIATDDPDAEHTACLVHYVDGSKYQYFHRDWQRWFRA